jgi:hypothetical protein
LTLASLTKPDVVAKYAGLQCGPSTQPRIKPTRIAGENGRLTGNYATVGEIVILLIDRGREGNLFSSISERKCGQCPSPLTLIAAMNPAAARRVPEESADFLKAFAIPSFARAQKARSTLLNARFCRAGTSNSLPVIRAKSGRIKVRLWESRRLHRSQVPSDRHDFQILPNRLLLVGIACAPCKSASAA